jgi:hypothetical protein
MPGEVASDHSELWGYVTWGISTVVVVVTECLAAFSGHVPWPTISAKVGHLEYAHSWVALIVVGVIVCVAYQVIRYPLSAATADEQVTKGTVKRTSRGRLRRTGPKQDDLPWWLILFGLLIVGLGSFVTAEFDSDRFVLAYVIYGLIALLFVLIPSALAFWCARDAPFPTFYRTLSDLEIRCHVLAVTVVIGLVILLIHLSLYPWPSVFHQLKGPTTNSP